MKNDRIGYKPQLDGVRFICIALVIGNHIKDGFDWIPANTGVDIFFALSGFLITTLLMTERDTTGSISLKSFYVRRIFRIVPLYYLAVLMYVAIIFLLQKNRIHDLLNSLPWIATFNSEILLFRHDPDVVFGQSWSVGIEEKFYILWPLAMVALGRSLVAPVLLAIVAGAFVLVGEISMARGYVGLCFGCCAALAFYRKTVPDAMAVLGFVALLVGWVWRVESSTLGSYLLISASSAILIAWLYQNGASWPSRLLGWAPFAWLGRLSYAIYIFHVLCINFAYTAFAKAHIAPTWPRIYLASFIASVVMSELIHRWIEVPCIRIGKRYAARLKPPADPKTVPSREQPV